MSLFLRQRETEHERGRGRERGRHRIGSRLQALSHQPRARRGARTHGPRDRDLSWSRTLNRLSHPGAPKTYFKYKDINRLKYICRWQEIYGYSQEASFFKKINLWGAWVAQSVKRPTPAQVTISRSVSSSPVSGSVLTAQLRAWSLFQILCLPLSLPLPCSCSVYLFLKNK